MINAWRTDSFCELQVVRIFYVLPLERRVSGSLLSSVEDVALRLLPVGRVKCRA